MSGDYTTTAIGNAALGNVIVGFVAPSNRPAVVTQLGVGSMGLELAPGYPLGRSSQRVMGLTENPGGEGFVGILMYMYGDVPASAFGFVELLRDDDEARVLDPNDADRLYQGGVTSFNWVSETGYILEDRRYTVSFDRSNAAPPPPTRAVLQCINDEDFSVLLRGAMATAILHEDTERFIIRMLIRRIEIGINEGEFSRMMLIRPINHTIAQLSIGSEVHAFPNTIGVPNSDSGAGSIGNAISVIPIDGSEWTYIDIIYPISNPGPGFTVAHINGVQTGGSVSATDVGQMDWRDFWAVGAVSATNSFREPWMFAGFSLLNETTGQEVIFDFTEGGGTLLANTGPDGATYDMTLTNENWVVPDLPPPDFEKYVP